MTQIVQFIGKTPRVFEKSDVENGIYLTINESKRAEELLDVFETHLVYEGESQKTDPICYTIISPIKLQLTHQFQN